MKTLLLMRHGKSSSSDASLDDFHRPLKKRGEHSARAMGRELRRRGILPDLIMSSPATRALETAKLTAESAGYKSDIVVSEWLYLSGMKKQLAMVAAVGDEHRVLMLFGHNPNTEQMVEQLTGKCVIMPTAALAHIEFKIDSWTDLETSAGRLVSLIRPQDLE